SQRSKINRGAYPTRAFRPAPNSWPTTKARAIPVSSPVVAWKPATDPNSPRHQRPQFISPAAIPTDGVSGNVSFQAPLSSCLLSGYVERNIRRVSTARGASRHRELHQPAVLYFRGML